MRHERLGIMSPFGWMREGWYRLRALGRGRRETIESRLEEEMRFHLEQQMLKNLRAGMDLHEAHRQALLKFGGLARTRGETRDEVRPVFLEDAWRDLRYTIRTLQRSPRFTLIAVLTLALGIGANTAIFSVVDRILFRPLPYDQPERLVAIHEVIPSTSRAALTVPVKFPHFQAWREAQGPFDQLAVLDAGRMTLTGTGEPERLPAARVSPSLFTMLGVRPHLGRLFLDQEDQLGRDHVAILSHELWRRRFDADPRIVGRLVTLNDEPYEIVGVLPAGFTFPRLSELYPITIAATEQPQIWKPFGATAADKDPRGGFNYACVARLAPGISQAQALSALHALQAALPKDIAATDLRAALVPLQDQITGRSRTGLTLLLIAVGAVLLIACVNITNLLLARTMGRRRELGIRSALGASRRRLVAQLLVESLFLSAVGGLLGVLTAYQALRVIVINAPRDLPMIDEVQLDGRILLFTLGTSLVTGGLVGLLPAWRFGRVDCVEALKSGSASNTGASATGRVRAVLVGLEVGLSAICLTAAGLLLHSFDQLMKVDLGFEAGRVVTVDVSLPARRYPTNDARINFVRALVDGSGEHAAVERRRGQRADLTGWIHAAARTASGRGPALRESRLPAHHGHSAAHRTTVCRDRPRPAGGGRLGARGRSAVAARQRAGQASPFRPGYESAHRGDRRRRGRARGESGSAAVAHRLRAVLADSDPAGA
jgi:predicted permease